ncbi:TonB-dependent receptor domain-containing protein [Bacteroidota bacterium]
MKNLLLVIICMTITPSLFAQKGFLKGYVEDGQFGGPLIGANVTVPATPGVGSTADFDGNFSISLAPGVYTIQVSLISYEPQTFPDIVIKAGEVTTLNATLSMATQSVDMVEVVATVRKNSEAGMLMEMKNATTVSDGLSSQSFQKAGDSDLSGAIKRVTGVTIQEGKNVYVRGLGDRYTKSLLNGMAIPGLDPDANSVQLDIFPTAVLENVSVSKTFSPNLDGDFTGGLVNVVTRKFPDVKTTQIQLGVTYIPGQHFNQDFILYNQGKLDWLGFDDGSRKNPMLENAKIPDEALQSPALENITRSFSSQLASKKKMALPNGSISFNHGNQVIKENGTTLGYNVVLNYSNKRVFYKDFESNDFLKSTVSDDRNLQRQVTRIGDVGKNTVMWSGLLTGSLKKGNSSFTATYLYNQSAETSAAKRINKDVEQNQATLLEDVLTFSQRTLSTFMLNGSHKIKKVQLDWTNAFSYSRVNDPDFRETRVSITDGDTTLSTGNGAGIDRFWRNLTEFNEAFKFDVTVPLRKNIDFKTGAIVTYKTRDFSVQAFKHRPNNLNEVSADADWYLQDENIWSSNPSDDNYRNGTYTIGNYQPSNTYKANQYVIGGYVMAEHSILQKLNLIYGARIEYVAMFYTGQNSTGSERYLNQNTLSQPNVLPALNMVYKITDKMNLRMAYSRTIARPSFKEKSIASIYDPLTKRTFVGNIDLKQTNIDNVDLRYEYFIGGKDMVSFSGFYKHFNGHIELVSFELAPDNIKPRNSGSAHVFGGEFEIRKGFSKSASSFLKGIYVTANVSIVHSMVNLKSVIVSNEGKTEFDLREENLQDGEQLSLYRPMAGQSPYAANASLSYEIGKTGTTFSLSYNVQGKQLTIIGSGRVPDVYTIPFHSLNFNMFHDFGKEKHSRLTFVAGNMLNQKRTLAYMAHGADDEIYTSYAPGVQITLKYRYTF